MSFNNNYQAKRSSASLTSQKPYIEGFRWQGEMNCYVGPFRDQQYAQNFADVLSELQLKPQNAYSYTIIMINHKWYIDLD